MMNNILIGWGEKSFVPNGKVLLSGQFYERVSEYVETDVTATAMALSVGEEQLILVSVDVECVDEELVLLIRNAVSQKNKELDPSKIVIGATHTHTSVSYQHSFGAALDVIREYLPQGAKYEEMVENTEVLSAEEVKSFMVEQISDAIVEAWGNREKAYYSNEFGRAAVGMCRRVTYDDGSAQMWGDTNTANFVALEGGNDSGIELLYTFDENKKLTGVVANIACPAQTLEHKSFISADYWGYAKEYLREKLGNEIHLLAMCGAAGDQCPRDLVRWVNSEVPINDPNIKRPNYIERKADPSMFDIKGCRLIGKRVANEILSVYEEIAEYKEEMRFEHKVLTMELPLRKATIADYREAEREMEYYMNRNRDKKDFNYEDKAKLYIYAGTILRYRLQQNQETVPTEIHICRLGDVAFMSNPFELYLDYANYIKARSLAKQTFIMQLACASDGYLPTEKAERGGHYSAYISSGTVGHQGGEQLARSTVEEINRMWRNNHE